MSLDGSTYTFIPYTLNGINNLATTNDIAGCVKYSGNTSNTDLDTYNLTTTGTITTNTINAQNHATPDSLSNSESWLTYSVSTFGNPSTLGGLITTEINSGNSMYFTGGVVGSPNFQFTSLGVGAGKVLATDANKVISTTINASQLGYITALTSQAGGVGQTNTWTGSNTFNTLTNVASLRITSSVANDDYTMSVNGFGQLEITNLTTNQLVKTDGGSFWTPNGNIYCNQTVYSNDLQLAGTSYFAYGTGQQWGTTLNGSGQYEIQDDGGVMRLRLSKTTGLTVSTLNITQVPSATPTYALGVNGGGGVVSFAVPSAVNLLPLNNIWTGTNTFNSTLTAGAGYTTNLNSALATQLNSLGFSSASFTTTGITGSYSPPLGTLTNVSGSTYQIAQTANGQSVMAISGFTPIVGTTYYFSINIKCTVGTATMYVEQNNSLRSPTAYALSTSFQVINGSFYYDGTANTIVFRIYTGTASWNAQWDSFTLSTYSVLVSAPLTLNTLATSRALITDGSKNVSTSITTSTELGYLSGTTSAIQTQLNTLSGTFANYLPLTGGTLTGNFSTIQATNISLQGGAWNLNLQPTTTSLLQTAGLSAQSAPGVISGSYTLTPSPTTAPTMGMYSPSQTFIAGARYTARFTGFLASAFGMSLRIYQANTANTATLLISTSTPTVIGTFDVEFFPNSNASYLGQVYLEFSGSSNKTVSWTSFTYTVSTATVNGDSVVNGIGTVNGNMTVNGTTTTVGNRFLGTVDGSNYFWTGLKGTGTEANRLGIGITGDATTGVVSSIVGVVGGTRQLNLAYNGNTYFERKEVIVNGSPVDSSGFYGQFRMVQGNYGAFFRNDGGNTFFLLTASGDQYGVWNGLRPWYVNNASGLMTMENGLKIYNSPQNSSPYSQVFVSNGDIVNRSQCMMKQIYNNQGIGWGGGVNITNAYYRFNTYTPIRISGRCSAYWSASNQYQYVLIRTYSQSTGVYQYFYQGIFTNFSGNHVMMPIDQVSNAGGYTGWHDIWVQTIGSYIVTDTNDILQLNVSVLPVDNF
jgi:hypothetical protein